MRAPPSSLPSRRVVIGNQVDQFIHLNAELTMQSSTASISYKFRRFSLAAAVIGTGFFLTGASQAASPITEGQCSFGPVDSCSNYAIILGGKRFHPFDSDYGTAQGIVRFKWNQLAADGNLDDNWSISVDFIPDIDKQEIAGTTATLIIGSFSYLVYNVDSSITVDEVSLEADQIVGNTRIDKFVITDAANSGVLSPENFGILTVFNDFNNSPLTVSGRYMYVRDSWTIGGNAKLGSIANSITTSFTRVPAPLPIFGAGIAFGFSRRLRKRTKLSAQA